MAIFREIKAFIAFLITFYPDTQFGFYLRSKYWGYVHKTIGPESRIHRGAKIGLPGLVEAGHHLQVGEYVSIAAGDSKPIYIGNYVSIAKNAYIRTANHTFTDLDTPIALQGHTFKVILFKDKEYSVVIEDDVWIAANAVILSGAHIGKGSIIGAGSVVSQAIPPNSIVLGNPGRVIGKRQ